MTDQKQALKSPKFTLIIWILFYIFIAIWLASQNSNFLDPDFGQHLKSGQKIINTHSLPTRSDSYITTDIELVDHEWLADAGVYLAYTKLGYQFIIWFFALLIVGSLFLLNNFINKKLLKTNNSFWLLIPLETIGLAACVNYLGVHLSSLSLLGITLLIIILYNYQLNKNWRGLLYLIPLFLLWANLHAGFFLGLAILTLFTGLEIINYLIKSKSKTYRQTPLYLIILTIISIGVTFINPYGYKLHSMTIDVFKDSYTTSHISEWQPIYLPPYNNFELFYLALSAAIMILIIAVKNKSDDKKNIWEIILIAVLWLMALKSKRNGTIFFIASLPFMISSLAKIFEINLQNFNFKKGGLDIFIKIYLALVLIICSASQLIKINWVSDPFNYFCDKYPCVAVNFLKQHPEYKKLHLLNEFNWGSFLDWTYPENPIFIDGNSPQVIYKGQAFLKEYSNFNAEDPKTIGGKLQEYNIGLVLIYTKSPTVPIDHFNRTMMNLSNYNLKPATPNLLNYLKNNPEWQKVFADNLSVVYVNSRLLPASPQ